LHDPSSGCFALRLNRFLTHHRLRFAMHELLAIELGNSQYLRMFADLHTHQVHRCRQRCRDRLERVHTMNAGNQSVFEHTGHMVTEHRVHVDLHLLRFPVDREVQRLATHERGKFFLRFQAGNRIRGRYA